MTVETAHFTIRQGEDGILDFTISGSEDMTTAAGFAWYVGISAETATASVSKTSGITAPDATSVQVQVDAADTQTLAPGDYIHQLWVQDSDSKWVLLSTGTLTLEASLRT